MCTILAAAAAAAAGLAVGFVLGRLSAKPSGAKPQRNRRQQKPQRPAAPPRPSAEGYEIYVGNLSYDMTEEQLNSEFAAYGKVNSARIITNRHNNKSKGFAFVAMPDLAEAERAVAALHDKEILGRRLRVNIARHPDHGAAN